MIVLHNVPHIITTVLWFLLVPQAILTIWSAPASVRLALILSLARFLFLSFFAFYIWGATSGANETLIDLSARLYLAIEATVTALVTEYWLVSHKTGKAQAQPDGSAGKVLPAPSRPDRGKHLTFTILLVVFNWSWLIYGFSQLHLR